MAAHKKKGESVAKIIKEHPIKLFVSVILATYMVVGTGFVYIDRARARTTENKKSIDMIKRTCIEQKKEQTTTDHVQDIKQQETEKDIIKLKSDIKYIKEAVDRIEGKM